MTKVTMKIPILRFRKEEVVETPLTRREAVRQALRAQQGRLARRVSRRTTQDAIQPEPAAPTSTWASRFPGMLRLSKQNPEAALKLDEVAEAYSSPRSRGRYASLGLLGLIGAGAGVVAARRISQESRAQIAQRTGGYVLIVVRQGTGAGRFLGGQAMRGAAAARARIAQRRAAQIDAETSTDRMQTDLSENQTLLYSPHTDPNAEA